MFIREAQAQAGAAGGTDIIGFILPMILIFVVFYFLLIRPQQKRMKQHSAMVKSLKRGDKIVTGGGLLGKVTKAEEDILQVEISPKIEVKIKRSTVSEVISGDSKPSK